MDIAVLVPDAAVLHCQADGEPVPDITWMRELSNGSSVELISKGNVTITEEINGLNKTSTLDSQFNLQMFKTVVTTGVELKMS